MYDTYPKIIFHQLSEAKTCAFYHGGFVVAPSVCWLLLAVITGQFNHAREMLLKEMAKDAIRKTTLLTRKTNLLP
jgi:hypothetical protein